LAVVIADQGKRMGTMGGQVYTRQEKVPENNVDIVDK
jgi:hypothetical protein